MTTYAGYAHLDAATGQVVSTEVPAAGASGITAGTYYSLTFNTGGAATSQNSLASFVEITATTTSSTNAVLGSWTPPASKTCSLFLQAVFHDSAGSLGHAFVGIGEVRMSGTTVAAVNYNAIQSAGETGASGLSLAINGDNLRVDIRGSRGSTANTYWTVTANIIARVQNAQ